MKLRDVLDALRQHMAFPEDEFVEQEFNFFKAHNRAAFNTIVLTIQVSWFLSQFLQDLSRKP